MVAGVMLAYDWVLALVAFATAAPLAFVLRSVQRHLVAAYDKARDAQRRGAHRGQRGGLRCRRRCAPTAPARTTPTSPSRSSHERSNAFIRAGTIGAFLFPVRRGVQRADRRGGRQRRPHPRPRRRADVGRAGRVHLPDLPVPRTDRRVHRGARPDADRRGRPAPGARRARESDRAARAGPPGARCRRARSASASRTSRSATAAAATTTKPPVLFDVTAQHPGRPAGRRGRRDRFRQDDARPADRPLRRSDDRHRAPRRRAADRGRQRRAAHAAGRRARRSRSCSTARSPPTSASPGRC